MGAIFGGGDAAKRAAEKQRQQQQIANDRQLSELRAEDARNGPTRRNPRGRRLFVSDASQKNTIS